MGTAGGMKYEFDKDGTPLVNKGRKLLLIDDNTGKPEGINLMIGKRPPAAFGNSTGDRQMLEYAGGDGARLMGCSSITMTPMRIRLRPGF